MEEYLVPYLIYAWIIIIAWIIWKLFFSKKFFKKRLGYDGELKENKRHGKGTHIWDNGDKYEGEWKNGKRCNGRKYNKYGKIIGKYVNGKYKTNKSQKPAPIISCV